MWHEKRVSTRLPVELPIKYCQIGPKAAQRSPQSALLRHSETRNVSEGGLLFHSEQPYEVGTTLQVSIPVKDRVFTMTARVAHTEHDKARNHYLIGVQFLNPQSVFQVKMAEQLHQIELYRKSLSQSLGYAVSDEEAAQRWVEEQSEPFSEFYK